jgi:hypothetical protein
VVRRISTAPRQQETPPIYIALGLAVFNGESTTDKHRKNPINTEGTSLRYGRADPQITPINADYADLRNEGSGFVSG